MIDTQSLKDLDAFALLQKLDYCRTKGGKEHLVSLMQLKESSYEKICERQASVRFIYDRLSAWRMQVEEQDIFYVMQYLHTAYDSDDADRNGLTRNLHAIKKFFFNKEQYFFTLSGIKAVVRMVILMNDACDAVYNANMPDLLKKDCEEVKTISKKLRLEEITAEPGITNVFHIDHRLRVQHAVEIKQLLDIYYELEAYYSLASAHHHMQLVFPDISSTAQHILIRELRHPLLKTGMANTIDCGARHLVIITGPNMSGKSTMMKSLGLAFMMAYMGVGIAADGGTIPVVERIVTYIDITDDLEKGHSYFFSEVKRVKTILAMVTANASVLVICDELFRGTNAQDSLDCNELVINTFLRHPQHYYFVATHYTAIAEKFTTIPLCYTGCFEGNMTTTAISFDYKWKPGISAQRIGLHILQRELFNTAV